MDRLFFFMGSLSEPLIILIILILAAPIVSIIALVRTASVRQSLIILRQQVENLERQVVSPSPKITRDYVAAEQRAAEVIVSPPVSATPAISPGQVADPPDKREDLPPMSASDGERNISSQPAGSPEPVATSATVTSAAFEGMILSLVHWFMRGNPLAKLGILLLFVGFSFLLRYSIQYSLLSPEVRLMMVALFAIALLGIGWRLRHRQPLYGLILQGGATGALYLTVFGAFRLWQMLPATLVFVLLVVICVASVALAVLQKTLSLAMLASLGGYLAPLLLSTDSGSFVALFSFYLVLSVGILAVSIWQHWRELNLLGLLFTFGVGGFWGVESYNHDNYLICQFFLIANLLIFGVLSVILSLRRQQKGRQIIDGVLLFVPPLAGFGMQYAMTRAMAYGPALSALAYGAGYLVWAWLALRRYPSLSRPLVLAALALGGTFTTLAIPLAFTAHVTAMAWALEGLGILWLGQQQQQPRMRFSGILLLGLAMCSGLWAVAVGTTHLSQLMIFTVLSLCWLVAAGLCRKSHPRPYGSYALLVGGIFCWVVALTGASQLLLKESWLLFGVLALMTISVWGWRIAGYRLAWPELDKSKWLLWPVMLVVLVHQITRQEIFSAGWPTLAWCIALPGAIALLYCDGHSLSRRWSQGLHLSLFWMLLLALALELLWFVQRLPWGMDAWAAGLVMAAGGLLVFLVYRAVQHQLWPFRIWPALYSLLAMAPVIVMLVIMLLWANVLDGQVFRQQYLPLINPLEEGATFALLGMVTFCYTALRFYPAPLAVYRRWLVIGMLTAGFWWINGALLRMLACYGDVTWEIESLWFSPLIQTSLALFWMLSALVLMLHASGRCCRREWLAGAALLAIVIVKLVLVDSARAGGLARAFAFIGVAILVLIVGYFSPLPPKAGEEK